MEKRLLVSCQMKDCMYYSKAAKETMARCGHKDKAFYSKPGSCPLYQVDWQRMTMAEAHGNAGS